jgi:hypothetical protein
LDVYYTKSEIDILLAAVRSEIARLSRPSGY